ncbi:uncharacterized protein LOC143026419 [Oratosquilla oratoria]|uniref:uncharacterized protein LOC143026419 n=1 Tax=Oratosquilla oratoria TaxID=337810 RepID=UPI003F75A4AB
MEPIATTTTATPTMAWYNYNVSDGILTGSAPVHVEIGSMDIARQINQQVQIQYGQLTTTPIQAPAQAQIIVAQPISSPAPQTPEPQAVPPKAPKVRVRHANGERVPCKECGKTFSCNANLRDHMRLHTGERPFVCEECGMSFAQRSNWRLHKRVHTGEKPYMCGICGKTFSRSSHLPGHMRIHTGEKPHQCDICEHAFSSAQALKNHVRTHTGEKPFVCELCHTAFTHSSSLSSHKKRCTGVRRKRGRPLGSGRKYRRKPTGRPRGRPRKKGRYGKRGRPRKAPKLEEEEEKAQEDQPEKEGGEIEEDEEEEEGERGREGVIPKSSEFKVEPDEVYVIDDSHLEAAAARVAQEQREAMELAGESVSVEPTEILGTLPTNGEQHSEELKHIVGDEDPLHLNAEHTHHIEAIQHIETHDLTDAQIIVPATSSLEETDLHQEAAVAMAALQQGGALNLAHHQLQPQTFITRDGTQTIWFPKQTF